MNSPVTSMSAISWPKSLLRFGWLIKFAFVWHQLSWDDAASVNLPANE